MSSLIVRDVQWTLDWLSSNVVCVMLHHTHSDWATTDLHHTHSDWATIDLHFLGGGNL